MKVVVGWSGGITSAWCGAWALSKFPKQDVIFLNHDTKEEDPDTYRFSREVAEFLEHPITECSDGRSVTELCRDQGALANNFMAFCSRELKAKQRDKYFKMLRDSGETEIVNVLGFSAKEQNRVQRTVAIGMIEGFTCRFPVIEEHKTKQEIADVFVEMGIKPPRMYCWSDHANCVGCFRGGKEYWLAVAEHAPDVFEQRAALEEEFGHTIIKDTTLRELVQVGLKRSVTRRESITISCECGD